MHIKGSRARRILDAIQTRCGLGSVEPAWRHSMNLVARNGLLLSKPAATCVMEKCDE